MPRRHRWSFASQALTVNARLRRRRQLSVWHDGAVRAEELGLVFVAPALHVRLVVVAGSALVHDIPHVDHQQVLVAERKAAGRAQLRQAVLDVRHPSHQLGGFVLGVVEELVRVGTLHHRQAAVDNAVLTDAGHDYIHDTTTGANGIALALFQITKLGDPCLAHVSLPNGTRFP